jgi:hypothetical protein
MTHMEFDPIIDGLHDARQLGKWLIDHEAHLDVSQAEGLTATRLIVEAESGVGQWSIPLRGGIDMVDIDDGWSATKYPANIRIRKQEDVLRSSSPLALEVEVLYTGIDDELRRASVDSDAAATFEPIPRIPNN